MTKRRPRSVHKPRVHNGDRIPRGYKLRSERWVAVPDQPHLTDVARAIVELYTQAPAKRPCLVVVRCVRSKVPSGSLVPAVSMVVSRYERA